MPESKHQAVLDALLKTRQFAIDIRLNVGDRGKVIRESDDLALVKQTGADLAKFADGITDLFFELADQMSAYLEALDRHDHQF